MNKFEQDYKDLLCKCISFGTTEENRTGIDTLVLVNKQIKFRPNKREIPLITGKKVDFHKAEAEFKWIFDGNTNVEYLNDNDIFWWDEYADSKGELGKTYGYQLRNYNGHFDQIKYVINEIKKGSRRAYMTFWNPTELNETALPCCYTGMKFTLNNSKSVLNASLQFRSSDMFLGLPYDFLFGYFMLEHMAFVTAKKIGEISYELTDAHIYKNHLEQVNKYIKLNHYYLPTTQQAFNSEYESGPYIPAKLNN